ncbi:MAG: metallophosphoesterase [Acetivibrionales bacterium]|jgi:putative phosphoesterase
MKLYLVISDTHGELRHAKKMIEQYPQINGLIHLGDFYKDAYIIKAKYPELKIFTVPGNCDFYNDLPTDIILEIEGKRILITHGHRYGVKNGIERLERKALQEGIDVVLFGHTHCPLQEYRSDILFVNPGSIGFPRSFSAPTYALLEISRGGLEARVLDA